MPSYSCSQTTRFTHPASFNGKRMCKDPAKLDELGNSDNIVACSFIDRTTGEGFPGWAGWDDLGRPGQGGDNCLKYMKPKPKPKPDDDKPRPTPDDDKPRPKPDDKPRPKPDDDKPRPKNHKAIIIMSAAAALVSALVLTFLLFRRHKKAAVPLNLTQPKP